MAKKMLDERPVSEFRGAGLLLLTNLFLHIFGWALVVDTDDEGNITRFYPAHCKFRGFDADMIGKAYEKVTHHMKDRMSELILDLDE